MTTTYLGKIDETLGTTGTFEWNDAGGKIKFSLEGEVANLNQYLVGENARSLSISSPYSCVTLSFASFQLPPILSYS